MYTPLRAAGLTSFTWPASDWRPWHSVRRKWLGLARERMRSGRLYVAGLRSVRLRLAALLPLLIGEATLDLLDALPEHEPPVAVKIPRSAVRRLLVRALRMSLRAASARPANVPA